MIVQVRRCDFCHKDIPEGERHYGFEAKVTFTGIGGDVKYAAIAHQDVCSLECIQKAVSAAAKEASGNGNGTNGH